MKEKLIGLVLIVSSSLWAGNFEEGVTAIEQGNVELAFTKFKASADQGNAEAKYTLGVMYHEGQGVVKNDSEAVKWFKLAADQGFASAQYNLGGMYYSGLGVKKNDDYAKYWLKKAAAQGFDPAKVALKKKNW